MAKHSPPLWDKRFAKSTYNQRRERTAYKTRMPVYYSDYASFAKFLQSNPGVRRVLHREALRLASNWRSVIPVDSTNGPKQPLSQSIRVRRKMPGGRDKDRQVYEVYTSNPSANYYAAEYAQTIKRGIPSWARQAINKSRKPE